MYTRRLLLFLLFTQVGVLGCHHPCHKLWNNVCRTIKREPKCFDYCDRSAVFHEMACCYWSENMKATPCSQHFRSGFLDGFADHLHRGGAGQAPVLPPRRYWEPSGLCRQNVIAEWRTGFAAGAESARDSGMRKQIVMPYDGLPVSEETLEPVAPMVTSPQLYGQAEGTELPAEILAPAPSPAEQAAETEEIVEDFAYERMPEVTDQDSAAEAFIEPATYERFDSPEPTIIYLSQEIDDAV